MWAAIHATLNLTAESQVSTGIEGANGSIFVVYACYGCWQDDFRWLTAGPFSAPPPRDLVSFIPSRKLTDPWVALECLLH